MRLRLATFAVCLLVGATMVFGQVGNGTITGTVSDQAGAVIAGASVEVKNTQTGVAYNGITSSAGVYTVTDLPVGKYAVTVDSKGFKKYTHTNLAVEAAGTLREDVSLQVGANTESVTVTAEASLLKTESAEMADNVNIDTMDALPMLGVGTVNSGSSGYRNPYNTLLTLPGVSGYASSGTFQINGLGQSFVTTETMRIEGQDATDRLYGAYDYTQMGQPSVDAVQEIAYQVSNYAPEFGQAGSVVINMTMKSGTNQYHGTGYDYFVNEDLNAGDPFTKSGGCITGSVAGQQACSTAGGSGGKFRPRQRRNDFGGTLGGPIYIPKIYNGHNKSFFFFNYEEFLEADLYGFNDTVPTPAFLQGNFGAISANGNCSSCGLLGIQTTPLGSPTVQVDPNGQHVFANEIFNPLTRAQATTGSLAGQGYATPFVNNQIPTTMFDPISLKILSYVPQATNGLVTGNYVVNEAGHRYSAIPAIKLDHNIDSKDKLSFYYSENTTQNQFNPTLGSQDGLPNTITAARGSFVTNWQERLNYDRTISPSILLHVGVGMFYESFVDNSPELTYNLNQGLGLTGNLVNRNFPTITGLNNAYGGLQPLGPSGGIQDPTYEPKPTGNINLTWVKGKHTFKFGGEWLQENYIYRYHPTITLAGSAAATEDPFTNVSSYGSYSTGFPFASFLLGDYGATTQQVPQDSHNITSDYAVFAQDSWKVTRKLTLDYGIRWDYDTPMKEEYNRLGQLDASLANTVAGGHPGALQFATNTSGFYKSAYPYAFGPRIGVAYQLDPKTVFRGGWGVNYQFIQAAAGSIISSPGAYNVQGNSPAYIPGTGCGSATGNCQFVNDNAPGFIQAPVWPISNQQQCPLAGATNCGGNAVTVPDAQENRPPRITQWSAGFQREITKSFIMEASYVGNIAAWLTPFGPSLGFLSQLSPQLLAAHGLYPIPGTGPAGHNNEADRALLADPLSSTAVQQFLTSQGVTNGGLPYAGFPTSSSLASSLYPFPQFGALGITGSPTGGSHYNSLQVKATKRLSHNLQAGGTYTFAKGYNLVTSRQDFFNPASDQTSLQNIPIQTLNFNAVYTVPRASFFPRFVNLITKDWQLGWFSNYQSGLFIAPPTSSVNANYQTSEDVRVAGQPLYTPGVNINNQSTYNPWFTQVLNPAAWAPCPSNANCPAAGNFYTNYRQPRTPTENANFARNFRIKERMNLQIRGEFVNILNRTLMPNISAANPQNPVTKNNLGIQTSGFGVIPAYFAPNTAPTPPTAATVPSLESRQGTLIARFSF